MYLYDFEQDKTRVLDKQARYVSSVAISADGKWVATGSRDRSVRLWAVESNQYASFNLRNPVEQVLFSRSGTELLAASGRAVHSWYVPVDFDLNLSEEWHTDGRTPVATPVSLDGQRNNLGIFAGAEPSQLASLKEKVEAALGRPVPRTDEYREKMLALLKDPNVSEATRVRAAYELSCLGTEMLPYASEVYALLEIPSPEESSLAKSILLLLNAIGPQIEPQLIGSLKAASPELRNGLVYGLGTLFAKSQATQEALTQLLADENEDVRVGAALALANAGRFDPSIPVLAAAIKNGHDRRREAGDALASAGESSVSPLIDILTADQQTRLSYDTPVEVARRALVALESAAVPQLTAGLRNYSGTPRQEIARTLAELGRTAAASRDELINLLSSEDGYTLQTVGSALAAVAPFDQSVAVAMINAIKTKPGAGSQLRYALARMDASAAIEPLRQELAQGSSDATEAIVYALGELKEKAAPTVPDLIALLEAPAVTFQTKDEIMEAIGKIGPAASSTAAPLLKMINALSGFPRSKVIETLGKIHADRTIVVPQLIDTLQNEAKKPRGEKI